MFTTLHAGMFNIYQSRRVGLSWQKLEWEWKEKGKGIAFFALNVQLHGCDLLDNRIGRQHTNFQISVTLSKKVQIFKKFYPLPLLKLKWMRNQNFFTESS